MSFIVKQTVKEQSDVDEFRGTSEESVLHQFLLSSQERVCDSPSLSPSVDEANTPLQSQPSSSASSSPERLGKHPNKEGEGGGEGGRELAFLPR